MYMYIAYTRRFSAFLRNALIAPKKRLSFYNSHRQVDKSWAFSPIRKTLTAATTNGVMWNSNNFITKKESYTIVAAAAAALLASCIDFPFLGSEISYVCARICFHYSNFVNQKKEENHNNNTYSQKLFISDTLSKWWKQTHKWNQVECTHTNICTYMHISTYAGV